MARSVGIRRWTGVLLVLGAVLGTAVAAPEALWLEAADGVAVRADLYRLQGEVSRKAPVVLLFHQARSNKAEYATIAPRLNALGFHALALDQRSGGDGRGGINETVKKLGRSTDYLEALPDLEAALAWKRDAGLSGPTLIWGSSYSAALVFLLAAEHPEVAGVLAFSPGEYLGTRGDEVRKAAARVRRPVLVLTPEDEQDRARPVVDALASEDKTFVVPERAVHGSSMLIAERNPGADAIWPVVERFLSRFR